MKKAIPKKNVPKQWNTPIPKPKKTGPYQVLMGKNILYSHWDGKQWGTTMPTKESAIVFGSRASAFQDSMIWRSIND